MTKSIRSQMINQIKEGKLDSVPELLKQMIDQNDEGELLRAMDDLYSIGFYPEVKQIGHHLLEKNPKNDDVRITLAEIALEDGKDLEALAMLQAVDTDSESYLAALLVEADYYESQSLPEVSLKKLKEAKSLFPDEEVIDFALAEIYSTMGLYGQAIPYYESLRDQGYEDFAEVNIASRLGLAYSSLGDFEQGRTQLDQASQTEENNDAVFQSAILDFQAKDYQKVIKKLEKILDKDPYYTSAYPFIAMAWQHLDNQDKALEWANKGLEYDHLNPDLYIILAHLYESIGDVDKAVTAYQEAYQLDPEHDEAFIAYLEYLDKNGDHEQVVELYEQSRDELQTIPRIIWLAARAYNNEEDYDFAREKYKEANLYLSDVAPFLKDYFDFLIEDGQRNKAQSVAEKLLKMEPDNQDIYFRLQSLRDE